MPLIQENISLKPYNTFSIAAQARYFVEIFSEAELIAFLASAGDQLGEMLVLGGGSNVLFTQDYPGLVVKIGIPGIQQQQSDGASIIVEAGAGVVWNDFVQYCVKNNLAGVENLSLIPGTVGASPIQNIGAYGVELKDVFYNCTGYEVATGIKRIFSYEDCKFGYRDSVFKNELKGLYIITSVSFKLSTQANLNTQYGAIQSELAVRNIVSPTIADISAIVSEIRVSKLPDPSTIGNAGSFFKNPVVEKSTLEKIQKSYPEIVNYPVGHDYYKIAAGWLIESCGFKGRVVGQTGTWKNQALVLVNHGHATGQEVYSFSEQIINVVCQKFGIKLEREVNIL
ncbi:UDP-N-acetylmuramate dehydrogenase [Pedobacter immunditicola]|uniref:UDP-N-acetylmuramate dehydrogenase n=1 Tax=Pedobacter immunditicola TaxID=3133440 RepID=UPI0030A707CD